MTDEHSEDFDLSEGVRVDMSSKEGGAKGYDLIPAGWYLVEITDVEVGRVASNAKGHKGKPKYNIEYTIQEGQYQGRHLWDQMMLFTPALYTAVFMFKALGIEINEIGERAEFQVPGLQPNVIPGPEWWIGKKFMVRTKIQPAGKGPDGKEYDERAVIKQWKPVGAVAATQEKARPSLLP